MTSTVAVVDYGMGNLKSVSQAVIKAAEGSGWGLEGVRERIKRLGGDFTAGPTGPAGPGWSVVVSAPA